MPEDPKQVFRSAREKQVRDAAAAAEQKERKEREASAQRQRERQLRQPEEDPAQPESEAARWVRDNMEWEPYPSLWVPKFCSWSDYSGSTLCKANGKTLVDDHGDLFEQGYGGHGTVWVGIPEDKRLAMTDEQWEAIKDIIEGLEDYPVIDEELMSEMEDEAKWEDWQEYGRDGLREALVKKFGAIGDVDAQIAVVGRKNAFWDEMFRENDWDGYYVEEEGSGFYFQAKTPAERTVRDDIVDDTTVEAVKREVFNKTIAGHTSDLEALLKEAGVDVEGDYHLWQMLKYAEHALGPVGVWSVKDRFNAGKDELDPADVVEIENYPDIVGVLSAPDAHQKMLHRHWAEDPRQLKLPGMESKAKALAASLLDEAEDPKSVLRELPRFRFRSASSQGEQVFLQSEEGQDWPLPIGCVVADPTGDPDSDFQFCIVAGAATKLGWKWWERVSPEVSALRFPNREAAAKHLWLLYRQSGALRESEDPKIVFKQATAAAPSYVIAGLSRSGMNAYFTGRRPYWTYNLKEAKRFPKEAALAKMAALRVSYPSITHRAAMRVISDKSPWRLRNATQEAEDPKSVLRLAQNPKGIPKRYVGNMPKEIEIWGRRWFSKTYGNTYFTARIYIDGQLIHTMPEEYGYGKHYMDRSMEWLEQNGYIPMRPRNRSNVPEAPWRWCEQHGIRLNYHAEDVLRRHLFREAQHFAECLMEMEL